VATGKGEELFAAAEELVAGLEERGLTVLYDDRKKVSAGVKFSDVELIGIPTSVVVGRGLANGVVEVKDRATGEAREVEVATAAEVIATLVAG
jgi:prolyl-tRNA synthetase